jgi:putative inorganic carbon (hco3(-)) transporter
MIFSILLMVISPFTAFLPAVYIMYKLFSKKLSIYKNPWNIGLMALFLWAVFSGLLNHNLISAMLSIVIFMYFCLSVYLQNHYDSEEKIEAALKYLIYFSIFSAILGIIEKLSFMYFDCKLWKSILGITTEIAANHRIYSTFGNPNVAGTWFSAMILICIYLNSRLPKGKKTFYRTSMCLFIFALYLTGSRGAEIGLLTGLLANYLLKKNKQHVGCFIFLLIMAAFVLFSPIQIFNINNLMYREISSSFSNRYAIWEGCLKMIKLKPIEGWGLMGIYNNSTKYIVSDMRVFHGHNIWVSITTTLGFIGLIIYLYMKYHLYKGIKLLYNNNCRLVPLLAGMQALVLGQGLVDFTIMTPQAGLLFISSSALIFSLSKKFSNFSPQESKPITHFKINFFN